MRNTFSNFNNKLYFILLSVLFLAALIFLIIVGKDQSFFLLNQYHSYRLDQFFMYYTNVGDGIFALILITTFAFVLKQKQLALTAFYGFLLSGLIAQILKNIIRLPRPKAYFIEGKYSHFIEHVTLSNFSSFPSGHTATAFAMTVVIAMFTKNKWVQISSLIMAMGVGYSRIYLGQHFLFDVLWGAAIGTLSAFISLHLAQKTYNTKWVKRKVIINTKN